MRMKNSKVMFIALASLLTTACGTENNDVKDSESDNAKVKAALDQAKIKIEEVSKVGFTEVEIGE